MSFLLEMVGYTYYASKQFDTLLNLSAHVLLPYIKVADKWKDKVQICYHHNIGHNITYEGVCKLDTEKYGYIDTIYLDNYFQWFGRKENYIIR